MADIHGVPDESMMVPEQSFTSEPLPDLSGSHPLQVNVAAGLTDDGEHIAAMNVPQDMLDDLGMMGLKLAPGLSDDGSPEPS